MGERITESGLPIDLIAILASTPLAALVLLYTDYAPIRYVVGLWLTLFPLGYAIVSLLLPEQNDVLSLRHRDAEQSDVLLEHEFDHLERVAISVGVSVVAVSALGLGLEFSPLRFDPQVVVVALSLLIIVSTLGAVWRRLRTPSDERYTVRSAAHEGRVYQEFTNPQTSIGMILNVLVVLTVVAAVIGSGYVITATDDPRGQTEFYVLTGMGETDYQAGQYPVNRSPQEQTNLTLAVENNDAAPTNYTVVALIQRVGADGRTDREREVGRFTDRVVGNSSWQIRHSFRPRVNGENVRLRYLLYRGAAPESPGVETANKELHIWMNVSEESAGSAAI